MSDEKLGFTNGVNYIAVIQHDEIQDMRQNLPDQALNAKRLQFSKDFEMLRQTRDAELSELRENQKAEFRQWVGLLYSTYQTWLTKDASIENHQEFSEQFGEWFGSINDLTRAAFQYYFPDKEKVSKELCGVLGLDKRSSSSTLATPNNEDDATQKRSLSNTDPALSELKAMGFGEIDARCALRLANGNMDAAIALLLDLPEKLQIEIQRESTQSMRPKTPSADAKASTNLLDMTRNWIGKTLESLSREDSKTGSSSAPKELKVSFTAVLGSHLRTPYQITLTASDPLKDNTEETRINTLALLYKPELTFRLVFFHPKYAPKYHLGRVANTWLFEVCSSSNELHFPSLSYQLAAALDKLQSSKASLQEGDFIITRHSNLPNTHVIVHMALDHSNNSFPEDLNQRALLISGIRSLLTTAQRYGASKLVLPSPELNAPTAPVSLSQKLAASSNPNMDPSIAAKIKLSEMFFKCIKGLLLETNRSGSVPYPVLSGATIFPVLGVTFLMPPATNVLLFKKTRTCIRVAFNP
ncbi:hypothetical protein DSO57_1015739 [Entomophthora muscae]|uniref:Uncharacterized protein n=1 Tax=Entomophthora muscae TaxID=34485 RepID=A0ACC2TSQ0_9FUNG|nr:hypothetical protein DSO57_1015739 [Entomophthora muscae]